MMMKSKIKQLALQQGLENPQQLAIKAGLPRSTIKNVWDGDIAFRQVVTLHKVGQALSCRIDDLFEVCGE